MHRISDTLRYPAYLATIYYTANNRMIYMYSVSNLQQKNTGDTIAASILYVSVTIMRKNGYTVKYMSL